jgi:hypothetical protein
MLLKKLKTYLKSNIDIISADFEWSNKDSAKLFSYLNKNFTNLNILDNTNQLIIKDAFRKHFEPIGSVLFEISQNQINLKIISYKIKPKDSANLETLLNIIYDNEDLIQGNYNSKEDLVYFEEELSSELNNFINSINNEDINKLELLKYAIREAFELSSSDIIIIKNDQIFIKLFDEKKIDKIDEDEEDTIANRFNSIDEDNLKTFYKNFFLKKENKNFFYSVAEQFVDIYFIDKEINNFTYEKYVFTIIQSIIKDYLVDSFDKSDEFFKGFSGYVFRVHFKEIFGHIANLILTEISNSNQYMMDFLKYYSLNIVVLNGKKYKVPEIAAENGMKWNVSSMLSIVRLYIKTETALKNIRNIVHELKEGIKELYVGGRSPLEYNTDLNKKIGKIEQTISHDMKKLNIYIDNLDSLKDSNGKDELTNDIRGIKHNIHQLKEDKEKLASNLLKQSELLLYTNTKKELDSAKRQEIRNIKLLEQNKDGYMSIKKSLVRALTSKKTPIIDVQQ